jgi:TolB-like protein/tetratricopeptide (TPR) repeat protein
MADVFVSYSRRDRARVAPLVAAIESMGWSVWWDPEIAPGQEFDRLIDAELAAASAVLVVWSKDSVESRWVRGEAREAADRGILVPVRFDDACLPIDVRVLHTIDLDGANIDARSPQVQDMLRALGVLVARRGGAAPSPTSASHASMPLDPPQVPVPGPERIGICALPFANLGGDPEQAYFSDGITEDIITELSRWRMLAVRSRAASFRYRGTAVDMQRVARELDVRFIVEGSVRRMGGRVRIAVQLIDAETGAHVWAEKFDRDLDELFAVQDQAVRRIVGTLVGRIQAADCERAGRKPPASLAAYECVLRGNALPWSDAAGSAEATRLFEQAIELDPGYGLAHALLAAMRYSRWRDGPGDSDAPLVEAYELAQRAVELDPNESTCFSILALVCRLRRAWELSLRYMRRAVELNPNNQSNAADMGLVLVHAGETEEALQWLQRAREIDPYFDQYWYWHAFGVAYFLAHRYDEALAMLDQATTRYYRIDVYRAACHARLGNQEPARRAVAECLALKPDFSIRHFMAREPFRNPANAAHLVESLRLAGLPE